MILVCLLIDILIVLLQHLTILVNCRPFRFSTRTDLGCVLSAEQTDLRGHIFLLMILLKEEMPTRYSWMGDFLLFLFDVHLVFMSNNFSCSYSDSDDISTNCTKNILLFWFSMSPEFILKRKCNITLLLETRNYISLLINSQYLSSPSSPPLQKKQSKTKMISCVFICSLKVFGGNLKPNLVTKLCIQFSNIIFVFS